MRSLAGLLYSCGVLERRWIALSGEAYRLYRDRNIRPETSIAAAFRRS
ncbi:hypothetical protein J1836_12920 [Thiothrix fructosivorans]|uniref:Uncharacterized protein n=1 Tax=Thiothrix fructosivorans TaxID=111770 RepID=A0ABS3ILB2_9GAMM|nr:hypothetical protein [Thiothrix fructosivorans]